MPRKPIVKHNSKKKQVCRQNAVDAQSGVRPKNGSQDTAQAEKVPQNDAQASQNDTDDLRRRIEESVAQGVRQATVAPSAPPSPSGQWERVVLAGDFPEARWDESEPCEYEDCGGKAKPVSDIADIPDSDKRLAYVAATRAQFQLDITECPFFTGRPSFADYKDVAAKIRANPPKRRTSQSATSSAPSNAGPADQSFSWAKWDNAWVVRGPSGKEGQSVDVSRKDGSTSRRLLGKLIKEIAPGVALYQ